MVSPIDFSLCILGQNKLYCSLDISCQNHTTVKSEFPFMTSNSAISYQKKKKKTLIWGVIYFIEVCFVLDKFCLKGSSF